MQELGDLRKIGTVDHNKQRLAFFSNHGPKRPPPRVFLSLGRKPPCIESLELISRIGFQRIRAQLQTPFRSR